MPSVGVYSRGFRGGYSSCLRADAGALLRRTEPCLSPVPRKVTAPTTHDNPQWTVHQHAYSLHPVSPAWWPLACRGEVRGSAYAVLNFNPATASRSSGGGCAVLGNRTTARRRALVALESSDECDSIGGSKSCKFRAIEASDSTQRPGVADRSQPPPDGAAVVAAVSVVRSCGASVLAGDRVEDRSAADPMAGEVDRFRWPGLGLARGELAEGSVRSRGVEVRHVYGDDPTRMPLVDDQYPVEQLPTRRADHPLADRVGPRRPRRTGPGGAGLPAATCGRRRRTRPGLPPRPTNSAATSHSCRESHLGASALGARGAVWRMSILSAWETAARWGSTCRRHWATAPRPTHSGPPAPLSHPWPSVLGIHASTGAASWPPEGRPFGRNNAIIAATAALAPAISNTLA